VSNLFVLCSIENSIGAVFQRVNDPSSTVDPGHCTYRNIEVEGTNGGFLCGFEIAGKDANNDFDHFIDVVLSNYSVAGWLNANTQSMSHLYDNCIGRGFGGKFGIAGNRAGTVGTQANFRWRGGFMAGHTECDFYINGAQNDSLIDGFDSEGSKQFIRTDGPSGAPLGIVIRQARWASNGIRPDGLFMDIRYPGPILMTDCNQLGSNPETPMSINWSYIPGGPGMGVFEIQRSRFTASSVSFPGRAPTVNW
jgi:hypothetical protein